MRPFEFESCGRSMRWYEWLAGLLLLGIVCGVRAQPVYKCTGADGSVAYQDRGCAPQQLERPVSIEHAPVPQPSPQYAAHDAHPAVPAHAARGGARRRLWAEDEPMSFECRASNGAVFYRHGGCPKSLRADGAHATARSSRDSAASVTVAARRVSRAEACAQIHRAGAVGRTGREHDEDVSTYDRNLGRDPCR